jgi:hypothetical protein
MFDSDRTCCVCTTRGRPVQLHHIDDDPTNHDESNLAVLCFDCHRDTQVSGGFDRKLDAHQVTLYRDDWKKRVHNRRKNSEVPQDWMKNDSGDADHSNDSDDRLVSFAESGQLDLEVLIRTLPERRRQAYLRAQPGWDTGVTAEMLEANGTVMQSLQEMLLELMDYVAGDRLDETERRAVLEKQVNARIEWHQLSVRAYEPGSGTLARVTLGSRVIGDLESMVEQVVFRLASGRSGFNYHSWKDAWRGAA